MQDSALGELLKIAGLPGSAAHCRITGADPILHTRYRVGEVAADALAAIGIAASELWAVRTGRRQKISIDVRSAAISLRGNRYFRLDGKALRQPGELHGFYRTRGGNWIFLHCNLPNLRDAMLSVLRVPPNREEVARACLAWDGVELEEAIFMAGGCAGFARTPEQWANHPQFDAVAQMPVLEIVKIGDSPPEPLKDGGQPLSGVRVLDLTRVIAGPVCGRSLAAHGADVLRITRQGMPGYGLYELDMAIGKLSAYLDLRRPDEADILRGLVRDGDVFLQSYRPGALAARGFSPETLAALRPGLIYVTLNAWGHQGPWSQRRGFDTVVQPVTGMAELRGAETAPLLLPGSVMDYVTGYLLAFGTMAALARRAREGGSWLVRASLAATGNWIAQRGLMDTSALSGLPLELPDDQIADLAAEMDAPDGRITYLKPALHLSETPPGWTRPPVQSGFHKPAWPPSA